MVSDIFGGVVGQLGRQKTHINREISAHPAISPYEPTFVSALYALKAPTNTDYLRMVRRPEGPDVGCQFEVCRKSGVGILPHFRDE